jgi:syntaxin 8
MSLPKLTSLSTQTLSLLLERQRLQSLSPAGGMTSALHIPQITRNLAQLRSGILELESTGEHSEAVAILRNQHARMCGMVGADAVFEPLPEATASGSRGTQEVEETKRTLPSSENPKKAWPSVGEHDFTPYSDDPEAGRDPAFLLQEQRRLMDGASHVSLTVNQISPSQREYRSGCTFRYTLALDYPAA